MSVPASHKPHFAAIPAGLQRQVQPVFAPGFAQLGMPTNDRRLRAPKASLLACTWDGTNPSLAVPGNEPDRDCSATAVYRSSSPWLPHARPCAHGLVRGRGAAHYSGLTAKAWRARNEEELPVAGAILIEGK